MARKTQARKQRMHHDYSQRKAAKARARRDAKPSKNANAKRSGGRGMTPFQLPTPMLAAFNGMQQFFAMQQLVANQNRIVQRNYLPRTMAGSP